MDFVVQNISSTTELVYQNEDAVINVYPQYHQVGELVYTIVNSNQWYLTSSGYRVQLNNTLIGPETVPMIQLVYTSNMSTRPEELNIFKHFTLVSTTNDTLSIYCSIQPMVTIRLRYRVLNKLDLAVPMNRYFAIGIGYGVDDDFMSSLMLTGYNPVNGRTLPLAGALPVVNHRQSGTVTSQMLNRLEKLERSYNLTFSDLNCFRIRGYSAASGGSEIITEYADYESVRAIMQNSWYQNCAIESVSEDIQFTTAAFLFAFQQASSLDVTRLYTQNVTDFNHMLSNNPNLQNIIGLDCLMTDNGENISYMFENDSALTKVDLSQLRLNKVTSIEGLFKGCSSLTEIDITSILFSNASSLHLYQQPDIFTGVPDNCHIIVADAETQVMIMKAYPNLTNVTTTS